MSVEKHGSLLLASVVLFSLLVALFTSLPAAASGELLPDRESTYPDEIENITHDPWDPDRGEDVQVTVTLAEDAAVPDRVSLLWCRVEPDYVCAIPTLMERSSDRGWTGTIEGSSGGDRDVIRGGTHHIGYNVTLMYEPDGAANQRIHAPLANHWAPDTFPLDTGGNYYFLTLADTNESTAPAFVPLAIALVSLFAILRTGAWRGKRDG